MQRFCTGAKAAVYTAAAGYSVYLVMFKDNPDAAVAYAAIALMVVYAFEKWVDVVVPPGDDD